jgi:hypothetical protein
MPDATADPVLEALWRRVLDAWDDPRAHEAALEHAVRKQTLAELAGRYRAISGDARRKDVATARLNAIVGAALLLMESAKTPPRTGIPIGITLSAAAACAVVLGWLAWIVFAR